MQIIRPKAIDALIGEPIGFTLMSDLHIGSPHVDYDRIKMDLEDAKSRGDRILINGDIFDLIIPSDRKRFRADAVHPSLLGKPHIVDAQIEWGVKTLSPYRELIDMIGVGNHEAAAEKYHGIDPIRALLRELNRGTDHVIHYAGYSGFVVYSLKRGQGSSERVVLYYHHGGGGSAPVTKGIIDFNRIKTWADADVLWIGHKHNRIADTGGVRLSAPRRGYELVARPQVSLMTGAYMYRSGRDPELCMTEGRQADWAEDMGMAPQGMGGARLLVKLHRKGGISWIRVEM